jgi:DNA helicase-2/ATP-dependent DNA helicase PcrA
MPDMTTPQAKTVAQFIPKAIVPTPEQLAIQVSPARMAIVEANAGAAKTTALALRMAEAWTRHTRPENILALTYTEAASVALRQALRKIGVPAAVVALLRITTFEAFCTGVLEDIEGAAVPVLREAEQLSPMLWEAVDRVAAHPDPRWRSELLMPTLGDHGMTDAFLRQSELIKGTMVDVIEREEQSVSPDYAAAIEVEYTQLKIYLAFERIRRANPERPAFRAAHDATYDLACLLHAGEAVGHYAAWPKTLRVVVVDEMHDMNRAMYTVLKAVLATNRAFFCGVGDRDQVIHKSAGADARFMHSELAAHSAQAGHKVVVYPLTHSFRFGPGLAALAGRIALKPYASRATHETRIDTLRYTDSADCARQVVDAANQWKTRPKARMAEFAVLLRHAFQSVEIENALIDAGLPYTTLGFESYVMRPEVLFVRGLLAVATDDLRSVTDPLTRKAVMQSLMMFSGSRIEVEGRERESQQDLLKDAIRSVTDNPLFLTSFFDNQILRNADPLARQRLAAGVHAARHHQGPGLLEAVLRALEITAMVNQVLVSQQRRQEAASNLHWLARATDRFASPALFFQHLNAAEQQQRESRNSKASSLLLASIASVKGLEFEHVVLPYLAQGEFPAPHADAAEELNTLYVGTTRARGLLTVLASEARPSEFMARMAPGPAVAAPGHAPRPASGGLL